MSGKFDHCILEVKKVAGRELTSKEEGNIKKSLNGILNRLDKNLSPDRLEVNAEKLIDDLFKEEARKAAIAKRQAALNLKAQVTGYEYIKRVWGDSPGEGLKALLGSSLIDREGSRGGVINLINSTKNTYKGSLMSKLTKEGLADMAANKSPEVNKQIMQAIWHLERGDGKTKLAKIPKEIKRIAELLIEAKETARLNANKSGAFIERLDSHVMSRSWDMDKVKNAAGDRTLDAKVHKDSFKKYIAQRLDFEKTFKNASKDTIDELLGDIWTQFSTGVHVKFNSEGPKSKGGKGGIIPGNSVGVANIGKRLSKHRTLHFKSPEAEFEVYNKFGAGGSVLENTIKSLDRVARDTAIMKKFGPMAEGNLDYIIESVKKDIVKENNPKKLQAFEKMQRVLMKDMWPFISGEADVPGNNVMASWNGIVRNWQSMTKLGAAVLSGLGDVPAYASTHRYFSDRNLGSFFNGMIDAVNAGIGGVGKKFTPDQVEMAAELSVFLDGIIPFVADADDMPGRVSELTRQFFKFNLLSGWQDRLRIASVSATAHRYAMNIGKNFGELAPGMQAHLRQFGINENDWNFIRKIELRKDAKGRAFLAPESLLDAPNDSLPSGVIKSKETGLANNQARKYKESLKDKLGSLYYDIAATATTEPNEWIKGMLLKGTQRGTALGETLRHLMQFKSFTASYMRNHLGRELYGYGTDDMSVTQALMQALTFKNKSSAEGLASLFVFGTAMGYASMVLKDTVKGRKPRIPENGQEAAKILMAAAAQSGSFGIYGDFLFGNLKSRMGQGPLETLLGPSFGDISSVVELYAEMRDKGLEGEMADVRSRAFRMALEKVPGYNLFYARAGMDYLITYKFLESINPGYLRRMERRVKKENNQEFYFPPSKYVK